MKARQERMKQGIKLVALCFLSTSLSFRSEKESIFHFREVNFELALEQAQKEGKKVFVEVMADWCGQCRRLENEILNDNQLDSVYQCDYVSIKVNGEKGEDGELCSIRYRVRAYPTLLYLTPQGKLLGKYEGVRNKSQMLNYAEIHR